MDPRYCSLCRLAIFVRLALTPVESEIFTANWNSNLRSGVSVELFLHWHLLHALETFVMYAFSQRLSFPGWIYFMSLFRFAASDAHPALNVNPTADPTVSVNPSACHEPNSHVTSSALNDRVPAVACEPPQNSSSCWNGVIVNSKNKTNYNVSCLLERRYC